MVAPGKSENTLSGKYKNTKNLYGGLDYEKARTIAREIIVIHAKDDEMVPFESGKDFATKIGAMFIPRETGNHMFK